MLAGHGTALDARPRADRRRGRRRGPAAQARRDRGSRRRHRGRHPRAPGHLPPRDRAAGRDLRGPRPARPGRRHGRGRRGHRPRPRGLGTDRHSEAPSGPKRPVASSPRRTIVSRHLRPHRTRKTPDQLRLMRKAGLLVGETLELLAARRAPGHDDERAGRARRGPHPRHRGRSRTSWATTASPARSARRSTTRSSTASRVRGCSTRATSSRSTAAPIVEGWHGDAAFTVIVGGREAGRPEDLALIDATEAASGPGSPRCRSGGRLYDVGAAVEDSHRGRRRARRAHLRHRRRVRRPRHRHPDAHGPPGPELPRARAGPKVVDGFTGRHRADGHPRRQRHQGARRRLDRRDAGRLARRTLGAHGRRHGRRSVVLTAVDGGQASWLDSDCRMPRWAERSRRRDMARRLIGVFAVALSAATVACGTGSSGNATTVARQLSATSAASVTPTPRSRLPHRPRRRRPRCGLTTKRPTPSPVRRSTVAAPPRRPSTTVSRSPPRLPSRLSRTRSTTRHTAAGERRRHDHQRCLVGQDGRLLVDRDLPCRTHWAARRTGQQQYVRSRYTAGYC